MAKVKKEVPVERDKNGFMVLRALPGIDPIAPYRRKPAKNPDDFLEAEIKERGFDAVFKLEEVCLGDYVYDKGIIHALNMNIGRNIPWIEDGLKPVERRVLYVMFLEKLFSGHYDKLAGIVGKMTSLLYPHGEAAPAETMYRMGRVFATTIPYVVAQGSFGNLYNLRGAAPRYAEASLSKYAVDCFFSEMDLKVPIYDTKLNYKYSDVEPIFLASKYPNVLMQWSTGIGKGAASTIVGFNPKDIFNIAIKMIDNPKVKVDIYPDTPTEMDIVNKKELKGCFDHKRFKVNMRGQYHVEQSKMKDTMGRITDKNTIVFTSIPLGTTGQSIINSIINIKELDNKRKDKKLPEVLNVEHHADKKDMTGKIKIIITYEKGYDPHVLAEKLFKSTPLGSTMGSNYNLVTDNKPLNYSPREILLAWINQRKDQKRRYYHQKAVMAAKDKAKYNAICTALGNIDEVIKIIRGSKDTEEAIAKLKKKYDFSEYQAKTICDIRLSTLSKMNVADNKRLMEQAFEEYLKYRKILASDHAISDIIKEELADGLKKYGTERRANLVNLSTQLEDADACKYILYNNETYYASDDYAKLAPIVKSLDSSYRMVKIQNADSVLVFSDTGMLKILNGYAFTNNDFGIAVRTLAIDSAVHIMPLDTVAVQNVALITELGYGKVMEFAECAKSVKSKVVNLNVDDKLVAVVPITMKGVLGMIDKDNIYYVKTDTLPVLKRASAGNRIIKPAKGVEIKITDATFIVNEAPYALIYGESGYMKVLDTRYLGFSKKSNDNISFQGKHIHGVVPMESSESVMKLYDSTGELGIKIKIDKNIEFTSADGHTAKFKMSTSIGSPVKVLRKSKYEFYRIK